MITKNIKQWKPLVACTAIGADVSKAKLNIAGIDGKVALQGVLRNEEHAIFTFVNTLKIGGFSGTIICEATSHYHMLFAIFACEAGLDIRVINPLLSSKHAKGRIRKTKTDAVDAITLATMVLNEPDLPAPMKMTRLHAHGEFVLTPGITIFFSHAEIVVNHSRIGCNLADFLADIGYALGFKQAYGKAA